MKTTKAFISHKAPEKKKYRHMIFECLDAAEEMQSLAIALGKVIGEMDGDTKLNGLENLEKG